MTIEGVNPVATKIHENKDIVLAQGPVRVDDVPWQHEATSQLDDAMNRGTSQEVAAKSTFAASDVMSAAERFGGLTQFFEDKSIDTKSSNFDSILKEAFRKTSVAEFNSIGSDHFPKVPLEATPDQMARALVAGWTNIAKAEGRVGENASPAEVQKALKDKPELVDSEGKRFDLENPLSWYNEQTESFVTGVHQRLMQEQDRKARASEYATENFTAKEIYEAHGSRGGVTNFLADRNIDASSPLLDGMLREGFRRSVREQRNQDDRMGSKLGPDASPGQIANAEVQNIERELQQMGLIDDKSTNEEKSLAYLAAGLAIKKGGINSPEQLAKEVEEAKEMLRKSNINPKDYCDFESPVNNYVRSERSYMEQIKAAIKAEQERQSDFRMPDLELAIQQNEDIGTFFAPRQINPQMAGFEDVLRQKFRATELDMTNSFRTDKLPQNASLDDIGKAYADIMTQEMIAKKVISADAAAEEKRKKWSETQGIPFNKAFDFANPGDFMRNLENDLIGTVQRQVGRYEKPGTIKFSTHDR